MELSTVNCLPSLHSDQEVLVRAQGVGKKFCRDLKKSLWYGLKDVASELNPFGRIGWAVNHQSSAINSAPTLRPGEFWANQDISFELRRGECLGLIGHNGAGKTTLLKMLNGLIKPDSGRIEMRGRVGALIALGAGFNPILTGRENIYVNGSILGLTKREIDEKIDDIIDFAEIRDFIDAPVQSYSSGMAVRLGFAVATAMKPDVLILDEVLAVGDISFRSKCYTKIGDLRKSAAIIFVSHNMTQVSSICSSCILLANGRSSNKTPVDKGISEYLRIVESSQNAHCGAFSKCEPPFQGGEVALESEHIEVGYDLIVSTHLMLVEKQDNIQLRLIVYNRENIPVMDWWSLRNGQQINLNSGKSTIKIKTGPLLLKAGKYFLSVVVFDSSGIKPMFWSYLERSFTLAGSDMGSQIQLPAGNLQIFR